MDTDGHEYQAFAENQRFTRRVSETRCSKSVFIRVYPWFMTASFNSNCGIKVDSILLLHGWLWQQSPGLAGTCDPVSFGKRFVPPGSVVKNG
jgi:hypothetical protein